MYSCGRDSTFKYKPILQKWGSASVLKFSRCIKAMVQFIWRLNKLFQATYYCTERWNVRKQNPCEPGLTTSWKTRDSIANRARNSFPYTPSGHNMSKPQVVRRDGRKLTLRSVPKASVDLPTLQRKEIGMCQWDRNCVQEQRNEHAQSFPPVPPTHIPQLSGGVSKLLPNRYRWYNDPCVNWSPTGHTARRFQYLYASLCAVRSFYN